MYLYKYLLQLAFLCYRGKFEQALNVGYGVRRRAKNITHLT